MGNYELDIMEALEADAFGTWLEKNKIGYFDIKGDHIQDRKKLKAAINQHIYKEVLELIDESFTFIVPLESVGKGAEVVEVNKLRAAAKKKWGQE